MARMKLDLPDTFKFSTIITVRITDVNYGGHLGNDAVLSIVHEARLRYLKSMGFSELDAGNGAGLIMSDAVIVFKAQSYHGDELEIFVTAGDFTNLSCDIFYKIVRKSDNMEIARVKTGQVFFDYKAGKPVRIPEIFLNAVNK